MREVMTYVEVKNGLYYANLEAPSITPSNLLKKQAVNSAMIDNCHSAANVANHFSRDP